MSSEKIDDCIVVLGKGLNGSTNYYALTEIKRAEVIPELGLEKFTEELIKRYPEACLKISRSYESTVIGDLPKEINLSGLEPYAMASILETVNEKIKRKV